MYAKLFRHVLFPAYEGLVRRRHTNRYMRDYGQSQWLSPDALARLQLDKLNQLLDHCWRNVAFLQDYWRAAGLSPGALSSVTELRRYPILTKQHISENFARMTATGWQDQLLTKTTGGSTGDPFRFGYTMESYARRTALMWRGYGWGGAGIGTRTAYLWGTGQRQVGLGALKDRIYHAAFNRRFLNAFALRQDNIAEYVQAIRDYRPRAVVGYVAPVLQVARWLNDRKQQIDGVRGVLTGAEALYEPERVEIARAFAAPVTNTYGCREFMLMASECEQHQGLHVNSDHLVVETVDPVGVAVTGRSGDVLVTDLHNYGMPFVRYRNGDRATASSTPCSCGRGLPMLSSVDGRVLETIVTPDGRIVPGEFFVYVMLDWPQVRQYQVAQVALDELEFRIVSDRPWPAEQTEQLLLKARSSVGDAMKIRVRSVPAIVPSRSGKRRVTMSLATTAAESRVN